ncbi:carbon monoxide dehydrogenase [Pseudolabrys taiwanensis]|uniref:Carbon monoxide dehydrogenase n=1 Tax=Pseudolabrys taiwanensis TaxID=331696 RepID=A0A345ZQQ4_9HYPH|nr:FAD binding domain-containing protein [Pseudolabrys taiwanensis]AXK79251.1 carbon monoxide dehydrogenase [Pseudolabrys taiwanensis]
MKPAAFDYLRAETIDEALAALAEHGADARIIAGGQSLMPMLNMRLAKPAVLIDIMRIAGLDEIKRERNMIVVPAAVRQARLLARPELAQEQPLLAAALPWLGHYQTRSRGTICGSTAHADPSAEIPLCLVALDGEIRLRSRAKRRTVKADSFFTGMMTTAKNDDEMIEAVAFPVAERGAGYAFREVARRHGDFAIVGCAAVVTARDIHFSVGGVADAPSRRSWPLLNGSALDDALNAFAWELDAREDIHATARLRRDLVRNIGRAVIEEATRCRG